MNGSALLRTFNDEEGVYVHVDDLISTLRLMGEKSKDQFDQNVALTAANLVQSIMTTAKPIVPREN